jgi:MYXO-CTERM domain-containing protein
MSTPPQNSHTFRSALAASLLVASGLTCFAAAPANQDFDNITPQESARTNNPSFTFDGVTYSTDATNDALRIDTIANVTGSLPTLGSGNGLSSVWYGTNTGTYLQFASVNNADDFQLLSLRAEVWGGSAGTAEIYTISGYDNGSVVVSATVTFTSSGVYGSGGDAIDYTRQTTSLEESSSGNTANAGLLVFGGNWTNIDQVRFTVADAKILGVSLDQISFAEPAAVPEPAQASALFGLAALGLVAAARRRRAIMPSRQGVGI